MALERLEDILKLNYHHYILEVGEAATIVMMGMAAYPKNICLATLKVNIENGKFTQAAEIKHQRFGIDGDSEYSPHVGLTEQREYSINMTEIQKKANSNIIGKENIEKYNRRMSRVFRNRIKSIRKKTEKLKVKY
jgi:2'-5' RNA ligase